MGLAHMRAIWHQESEKYNQKHSKAAASVSSSWCLHRWSSWKRHGLTRPISSKKRAAHLRPKPPPPPPPASCPPFSPCAAAAGCLRRRRRRRRCHFFQVPLQPLKDRHRPSNVTIVEGDYCWDYTDSHSDVTTGELEAYLGHSTHHCTHLLKFVEECGAVFKRASTSPGDAHSTASAIKNHQNHRFFSRKFYLHGLTTTPAPPAFTCFCFSVFLLATSQERGITVRVRSDR